MTDQLPSIILVPLIALNIWTFLIETWMCAVRIPAFFKYKIPASPTLTKESMNAKLPPSVRWKVDNYNHLFEQPTQFYAIVLALAVMRGYTTLDVGLAWAYVAIRVMHSLVQCIGNWVLVRFWLFVMSSVVLMVLTGRAVVLVLGGL
ncbi:hypothetical protein K469DRAFT_608178 [Zopfia rhizophila CBS 207.26]|uniref:MAPEG family protein n=1 Tax=Zopfia rhizophila CBS 207.26 TaxID=1314779 RepID=A0A6A6D9H4_9PEZI|nr:hypothetical protein K469DRAFT_608178 [Zopfia rhizophila CBS 207.26]